MKAAVLLSQIDETTMNNMNRDARDNSSTKLMIIETKHIHKNQHNQMKTKWTISNQSKH